MADDIYIEYWPLGEVLEAPVNPKEHDLKAIGTSMNRFGYTDPMMIDERTGRLVRGHGRREELLTLKEQGHEPPLRIKITDEGEWLVPVVRGVSFNSDNEALAYSLADNRLTELGGWDRTALAEVLGMLVNDEESLEGTGFSELDMAVLVQEIGDDVLASDVEPPEDFKEYDEDIDVDYRCPKCGYEWSGKPT